MQVALTNADRLVLESYKNLADGLSEYLGEGYEIVLHSLEDLEHSVIYIINGEYTGRKIGYPITNIALSMLKKIMDNADSREFISYFTKTAAGKPLKSCTIAIKGTGNKIIGLLCINLYLDTPYYNILNTFLKGPVNVQNEVEENFSGNTEEMVKKSIDSVRESVIKDGSVASTNRNNKIIQQLYDAGIFNFKDAVEMVADELGICRSTVYMHIRKNKN